ncbi:MAG TPA: ATP-binding protein [Bryobacteraceae bacterium]|nr:ATP-binding protein [Bryobacteraceae bacterium]
MGIEKTDLFREMLRRSPDVPAGPPDVAGEFEKLRKLVQDAEKYIALSFPEHTPHDRTRHLDSLFALADRILGMRVYAKLAPTELILLAFGLYAHDWGMAVGDAERRSLFHHGPRQDFVLLADEPSAALDFVSDAALRGISEDAAWRDYLRRTHGLRSGARLRHDLERLSSVFADAVARVAEGHTLDLRELRDSGRYPVAHSVFGDNVNIAALTAYVRIIDLLDIGDDRTPYALWEFVAPLNPLSRLEWQKHRALSPIAVTDGPTIREIVISGRTNDAAVFAALADLRSWVDGQFAEAIALLRLMAPNYHPNLDSRISWNIEAVGFKPTLVKFDLERTEVLGLLSTDLYRHDPLAFLRELLQNSVDAIDTREAFLRGHGLTLNGHIRITLRSTEANLVIEWSDNGIGMDENVLSSYFATVGRSWYRSAEARRLSGLEAVSQFGIGVLSCFMVSSHLALATRKDPIAGGSGSGLLVEIPARDSHFRIQLAPNVPIGTTVRLEILPQLTSAVSKQSVCRALAGLCRYVRHSVTVDSDAVISSLGLHATCRDDLTLSVRPIRGDAAEILRAAATVVDFDFGDPSGDLHGHYSALIPTRPADIGETAQYRVWRVGTKRVDFDDIVVNTEQAVFVKGVRVGPVGPHLHAGVSVGVRRTEWIAPKVLLNLRRPSFLQFALDRSEARFRSGAWNAAWQEIARTLRARTFTTPVATAADAALLLGSCALFGGIPDEGLDKLLEEHETPLLVLRSGGGVAWRFLKDFALDEEYCEAPFELGYAWHKTFGEIGNSSALSGWEGEDMLFPLEHSDPNNYPYLRAVFSFDNRVLTRLGWQPVALSLVSPSRGESVPLGCRVWRKLKRDGTRSPENEEAEAPNWAVLKTFYDEAPEILQFPATAERYAAIGSRYWNGGHPKVAIIVRAIRSLLERHRAGMLATDRSRLVGYLTSNSFYDYTVPSRMSGRTLAIDLPNRLLDIAEEEGLSCSERLAPGDFFPSTVGRYCNPYSYDLRVWERGGTNLGRPLVSRA